MNKNKIVYLKLIRGSKLSLNNRNKASIHNSSISHHQVGPTHHTAPSLPCSRASSRSKVNNNSLACSCVCVSHGLNEELGVHGPEQRGGLYAPQPRCPEPFFTVTLHPCSRLFVRHSLHFYTHTKQSTVHLNHLS